MVFRGKVINLGAMTLLEKRSNWNIYMPYAYAHVCIRVRTHKHIYVWFMPDTYINYTNIGIAYNTLTTQNTTPIHTTNRNESIVGAVWHISTSIV